MRLYYLYGAVESLDAFAYDQLMKNLILTLFFTLISYNSFSNDCSTRLENLNYEQLDWFTGSNYTVNSSIQDVRGILCIGFSNDREIKRVHYFDDLGTVILKDAKELYERDVVFFSRNVLPLFIRGMSRSSHPMTISIVRKSQYESVFKLKFVENIMKGFGYTKVREVCVNSSFKSNTPLFTHKGVEFDEFNLYVSNTMRIKQVSTYFQGKRVQSYQANEFKLTKRKY